VARKRDADPEVYWSAVLIDGVHKLRLGQRMFRRLPSAPRCKMCHNPFSGWGGRMCRLVGHTPSRKNPNLCAACCDDLPAGGIELDVAVLFADVRGSTGLAEAMAPADFAALLQRFYVAATEVLVRHDAIVDKLIGDEVMAFFVPGIAGPGYRRRAVESALALAAEARAWLPLGIAVHAGPAFVGNVGEAVVDFTALGDTVNAAARLQAEAAAGEVIVSDAAHDAAWDILPAAERRSVTLRGRNEPLDVLVVRP
jgi:adenylate cyclase